MDAQTATEQNSQTVDEAELHADEPEISESFYGFVASKPQLKGDRLYFKAGQEHYRFEPDGTRVKLRTTFHDMVAFKGAATSGDRKLAPQDWFLAHGRTEERVNPNTGVKEKQFIANRFGHDIARMNYEVGTPRRRAQMDSPNRGQQRTAAFEPVEPAHEEPVRAM